MDTDWIDLGPASELLEGAATLRKHGDHRFVCVRLGDSVHAMDDRCPHQGYPLSQGSVRGCELTCDWHNWKFDLRTGACSAGGDAVRRYATRIEDGRLHLNMAIDTDAETRRFAEGLRTALAERDLGRATREALRLAQLQSRDDIGRLGGAFETLIADASQRAEWGFGHDLAVTADLCSWIERGWIDAAEGFVQAADAVGTTSTNRPARVIEPCDDAFDAPDDPTRVTRALIGEQRESAQLRIRFLFRSESAAHAVRHALVPFLVRHLYDYGHGVIYTAKALELCERFPAIAEEVLVGLTFNLSWATAETATPPFTATRRALELHAKEPTSARSGASFERSAYERAILTGEREGIEATMSRLTEGCDPLALLRAAGHAAAIRLSRFDSGWESNHEAEVGALAVTHTVTFVESVLTLSQDAPREVAAAFAIQAAGFIGKVRKADRGAEANANLDADIAAAATSSADATTALMHAARARRRAAAVAAARSMAADQRQGAYEGLAPLAAFDAASHAIRFAHTIKTLEALRRLELADDGADHVYLEALVSYLVPRRPETNPRRVAAVAKKFLADGRPPVGLY